jgi:hypothetical protein
MEFCRNVDIYSGLMVNLRWDCNACDEVAHETGSHAAVNLRWDCNACDEVAHETGSHAAVMYQLSMDCYNSNNDCIGCDYSMGRVEAHLALGNGFYKNVVIYSDDNCDYNDRVEALLALGDEVVKCAHNGCRVDSLSRLADSATCGKHQDGGGRAEEETAINVSIGEEKMATVGGDNGDREEVQGAGVPGGGGHPRAGGAGGAGGAVQGRGGVDRVIVDNENNVACQQLHGVRLSADVLFWSVCFVGGANTRVCFAATRVSDTQECQEIWSTALDPEEEGKCSTGRCVFIHCI